MRTRRHTKSWLPCDSAVAHSRGLENGLKKSKLKFRRVSLVVARRVTFSHLWSKGFSYSIYV